MLPKYAAVNGSRGPETRCWTVWRERERDRSASCQKRAEGGGKGLADRIAWGPSRHPKRPRREGFPWTIWKQQSKGVSAKPMGQGA